jgi:hypothetical protein
MRGKTVVITGGTSGNREVATEIGQKGRLNRLSRTGQDPRRRNPRVTSQRRPGVAYSIYFADLTRPRLDGMRGGSNH